MSDNSHIEWTEATWNPLVGCTKVSAGCDNCYAETLVNRFAGSNKAFPNRFDVVTIRDDRMLTQPLRWARPRRIFVNSLSDLFHADVPDAFIARVFAVMAVAERHTFQLLTKRHGRMRTLLNSQDFRNAITTAILAMKVEQHVPEAAVHLDRRDGDVSTWWPLRNVWLGVSVEDQHWADIRIPALLATPAAVRWISAEPLLGPVKLDFLRYVNENCTGCHGYPGAHDPAEHYEPGEHWGIDWVVTGGESGPSARPMDPVWAVNIGRACKAAGVAWLHKQNGCYIHDPAGTSRAVDTQGREYPTPLRYVGKKAAGRELAGQVHDGYPAMVTA